MTASKFISWIAVTALCLLPTPLYATIVVVVPTRDGILVCTDKRRHREDGDSDDITKIKQLGSRGFFVTTGAVDATEKVAVPGILGIEYKKAYDLDVPFKSFVHTHRALFETGQIDTAVWSELRNEVAQEVSKLNGHMINDVRGTPFPYLGTFQLDDPRLLFDTQFIYINAKTQVARNELACVFDETTKSYNFKTACELGFEEAPYEPKSVTFMLSQAAFFSELKTGSDSRFDVLRKDKRIKPFLADDIHPQAVTVKSAEEFARLIIQLTSD